MGNKKNRGKDNKNVRNNLQMPLVSVCTPTFNRRPFISSMIKCFNHQTYPKDRIEWIIIDDGTDKIEDLVCDIPQVKYFKYDTKMTLGKKRNLMHEKSVGDILVYMDDDDYYPPERISHAVSMLQSHPKALCAGASEIYIYFKHINQMVQFGPYGPNHATAGTFAFKRELLKNNSYDNEASLAEEKSFLNDYTVPFVQLEPKKTILVFSHIHNTFDKKKLLDNRHPNFVKDSEKTVDEFVKQPDLKEFYMNQIEGLLVDYEPGRPEMKPDVLKQIIEINKDRDKMMKEQQQQMTNLINELQQIAPVNPIKAMELMQKNPQLMQHMVQNNQQIFQQIQQNAQRDLQQQRGMSNVEQEQIIQQRIQQFQQQNQQPNQFKQTPQFQSLHNQQQIQEPPIRCNNNGQEVTLTNNQIVEILQQQQLKIQQLLIENEAKDKLIVDLNNEIKKLSISSIEEIS